VPIIEGLNHSLKRVSRDYKEVTLIEKSAGKAATGRERTIPTSGEMSLFIIAFL
jgi:hypothetical protein